jgi:ABC-type multidrug transport system permease subunit
MVLVLIGEALMVTVLAEAYASYYTMRPLLLIYGAVFAVLFIATVVLIIFIVRRIKF